MFQAGCDNPHHANNESSIHANGDSIINCRKHEVEMRRPSFDFAALRDLVSSLAAERSN
jgi:hypothetical protein